MTDMIRASGLVKRFGDVVALDRLDLDVPEGTILGLLGPNGAGKTTAVSILTTLLPPDEGSAVVAGHDVAREPDEVRKRIGLSGQYAAVDEVLTGFENLVMIGHLYHLTRKAARARADELLERMALTEAGRRPVKTYSGGMRRRLDLAGALVAAPPVLFLDEPTTGLDPRSRVDLWALIRELVAAGSTLLLTTQYLEEADQLADDILVVDHGRAIARGTADELKAEVGGERIAVTVADSGQAGLAHEVLAGFAAGGPPERADATITVPVAEGATTLIQGAASARRPGDHLDRRRPPSAHPRRRVPHAHGPPGRGGGVMTAVRALFADSSVVAGRNVKKITRVPEVLVFVLLSPIMFVLLFAYVFGGAIDVGGVSYREFLIAGIFAQTVLFGATFTGAGIAEDMQKGIINRFRSLPMSRAAVLVGRTVSDVIYNVLSVIIMSLTGLLVGWRIRGSLLDAVGAYLLLLAFAYGFSWVMAYIGLLVPSPEVVNNASFMVIFPVTFVANTFVRSEDLPGGLRTFAEWNPVSTVTQASRELFGNLPEGAPVADAWSLQHPVAYTLIWVVVLIAVFAPLSVARYKKTTQH